MLLPLVNSWYRPAQSRNRSFDKLAREGFKQNSAIASVVTAWTLGVQEPVLCVRNKEGELQPDSELQTLLDYPNPEMDGSELAAHLTFYRLISGNAYLHIVRDGYGKPMELWPYSDAHITPVAGQYNWIDHYRFNDGETVTRIEREDIIHLKWFNPDPERVWMGYGPLQSLTLEVDADSELSKFIYALLYNDAFPRTALMVPPNPNGSAIPPGKREEMKAAFKEKFGGRSRGDVIVLQGTDVKRLALDLKELQADFLRNGPESRICAVFRTPIEVIGMYAGLEHSTYSNKESAQKFWTENTLAPYLKKDARAMTRGLIRPNEKAGFFAKDLVIGYDFSEVVALRSNQIERDTSLRNDYTAGIASLQEVRDELGYGEIDSSHSFALGNTNDGQQSN